LRHGLNRTECVGHSSDILDLPWPYHQVIQIEIFAFVQEPHLKDRRDRPPPGLRKMDPLLDPGNIWREVATPKHQKSSAFGFSPVSSTKAVSANIVAQRASSMEPSSEPTGPNAGNHWSKSRHVSTIPITSSFC
jgi:hypothetical protein